MILSEKGVRGKLKGGFIKMLRVWGLSSLLLYLLLSYSCALWADEKKEVKLEEIIVTATKTEKAIEDVPASVNVVTKEDIEKRVIRTLDDAVNNYAGVYVHRTREIMDTPTDSISLRGIPGNRRNLILLDGVPFQDPQGGTLKFGGLNFEDIERIEVVRGPFSSLYGGLAMGGVMNIMTKMPEKREFVFKTGYGTGFNRGKALDDLRKIYLSYGDRILSNKLNFFISYSYEVTNGFPTTFVLSRVQPPSALIGWNVTSDPTGEKRFLIGDTGDQKGYSGGLKFKLRYDFDDKTIVDLSFSRIYGSSSYDTPHSYLRDSAGNMVWNYGTPPNVVNQSAFLAGMIKKEINFYSLSFERDFNPLKMKVSIGLHDSEKYLFTTPCVGTVTGCGATAFATITGGPGLTHNTPAESYNLDAQFILPLFKSHILTFGGSYKTAKASTTQHELSNWQDEGSKTNFKYETKGKEKGYSFFVQDEILLLQNLTAYLGVRYDWWETFDGYENDVDTKTIKSYPSRSDSNISPKVSVVYKPFENTILRTSAGTAFRPPMNIELYRRFMTPGSFVYGNPNLKPETTTSWDIGIAQKIWEGSEIKVTYFENYLKDLIYSRDTGQKIGMRSVVEMVNAAKVESKGVEVEIEQRINKMFKVFGNFTYTHSEITENPAKPATEGKMLTGLPEKMFNIGLEFEKGPLSASLVGRYRSKAFGNDENRDNISNVYGSYDPHFVADAKISYKLTKYATLSLTLDNIFNREYYYFYKQPGRSWFLECKLRL